MGKEESVKVTVAMPKVMYEQLEELKKKKGKLSIPELVREALIEYIERERKKS